MGGWSGGVYSRFRNWVTDKANSINPQAALFDQEDDGFAAGLNNCVTKDGLNKPSSAMDWNGQNLTGVLNFANTGTVSLTGGKFAVNGSGNVTVASPGSGVALTVNGVAASTTANFINTTSGSGVSTIAGFSNGTDADFNIFISQVGAASKFALIGPGTSIPLQLQTGGTFRAQLGITNVDVLKFNDEAGTLQVAGYRGTPLNTQGGNYTLVHGDVGKTINASATINITVPSGIFAAGDAMSISVGNGATVTVVQGAGLGLQFANGGASSGNRTLTGAGMASILFLNSSAALITGSGLT